MVRVSRPGGRGCCVDDLTRRLYLAAHDEWDISAESRDLARDALAEIERLRALLAEVMRAEAARDSPPP